MHCLYILVSVMGLQRTCAHGQVIASEARAVSEYESQIASAAAMLVTEYRHAAADEDQQNSEQVCHCPCHGRKCGVKLGWMDGGVATCLPHMSVC